MLSKKELRPEVQSEISQNELETFQNDILRPILKLQHSIIQQIFENYLLRIKQDFDTKETKERSSIIWHSLKSDKTLQNLLLGCIVGLLETDELTYFLTRQKELSKRINGMLIKRIESMYS